MNLNPGDRLGPYVVVHSLGAGGMGEVFKAQDTRLHRFVALKVIAQERQDLEESRQRFASEGRAIAALNHPHICALYDTGFDRGRPYLVMEYLDGETLAERLQRGRLPLAELIGLAIEMADALDYAHRHGIVHRDLKPANVFIAKPGGAKLLDFGLSSMRGAADAALADLATQPMRVTAEGSIVGTLHYLAPERLDGKEADACSDIYAFGVILHELLSGKRPFDEPTQARLIAAILKGEPSPIDPPAGTPAELHTIVRVALARDPADRWQSVGDVAKMLKAVASRLGTSSTEPGSPGRARGWPLVASLAVVVALAIAVGALVLRVREPPPAQPVVSLSLPPPSAGGFALTSSSVQTPEFAVSPDGGAIVFVAAGVNRRRKLWIRSLDDIESRPVEGSDGASYPFWSPDGRSIAFFADRQLKRISWRGGPAEKLCEAPNGRGGTWNAQGDIVFAPNNSTPLFRISADGRGGASELVPLGANQDGLRWPQFLPDGKRVLYFVKSAESNVEGIYLTSLDAPAAARRLRGALTNGLYASGRLLYVLEGMLLAQRLDPDTGGLSGESVPLRLPVSASSTFYSAFSVTEAGVLATWSAGDASSELIWFDRAGKRLGPVGSPAYYIDFRLSPDQNQLAFARVDGGASADLWVMNLARGIPAPLTSSPQNDATPIWSPDGSTIVFRSNRHKVHELFERPAHRGGEERRVYGSGNGTYPTDFTPDGRGILYHESYQTTRYDISLLDLATKTPQPIVDGNSDDAQGQVTEDGRLAFTSDASGEYEVYVGRLDRSGRINRVSPRGGFDPRWSGDGRELFYVSAAGELTVAQFLKGDLEPGRITPLFQTGITPPDPPYLSQFVPNRDGSRFLIKVPVHRLDSRAITVTHSWQQRLASGS
jgi:serine/threonine protein kinase/Tol biopolymer transport system component